MTFSDVLKQSEVFSCVLSIFERVIKNLRHCLTLLGCFDVFPGVLMGLEQF